MINIRPNLRSVSLLSKGDEALSEVNITYTGSAKNDGSLLSPDRLCYMLEQVSSEELSLVKAHRENIILED